VENSSKKKWKSPRIAREKHLLDHSQELDRDVYWKVFRESRNKGKEEEELYIGIMPFISMYIIYHMASLHSPPP
jgi:hypothetical protein